MPKFRKWLSGQRGAATTEKLFVLLFAVAMIGGAILIFGPTLIQKYSFAADMLGMSPEPTPTLADGRVVRKGTNPVYYLLYTAIATGFFAAFVAPLLFPRARDTRRAVILSAAERFPFLAPLIDRDALSERGLRELRGLAAEVNALEKHKSKALDIQPHDFGNMALPSEQTVDASFSEMPDIDDILAQADPSRRSGAQKAPRQKSTRQSGGLKLGPPSDQSEDTQTAVPLSARLSAIGGDDDIPFDAIHPSVKPQLQPNKPMVRNPSRPMRLPVDDSTTVDVGEPKDIFTNPDALAARILGESGALAAASADADATLIHNSQPLQGMAGANEETARVASLPERLAKSGPLDSTTPDNVRRSDALDATTQDYGTYDPD